MPTPDYQATDTILTRVASQIEDYLGSSIDGVVKTRGSAATAVQARFGGHTALRAAIVFVRFPSGQATHQSGAGTPLRTSHVLEVTLIVPALGQARYDAQVTVLHGLYDKLLWEVFYPSNVTATTADFYTYVAAVQYESDDDPELGPDLLGATLNYTLTPRR